MKLLGAIGIFVGLGVLGLGGQAALGQWNTPNPVVSFEKTADGVVIHQKDGVLRLAVNADDLIHVTYAPPGSAAPERASDNVVIKNDWPAATFDVAEIGAAHKFHDQIEKAANLAELMHANHVGVV